MFDTKLMLTTIARQATIFGNILLVTHVDISMHTAANNALSINAHVNASGSCTVYRGPRHGVLHQKQNFKVLIHNN